MRAIVALLFVLMLSATTYAEPNKKAAVRFVKQLESAVQTNDKIIGSGSNAKMGENSRLYSALNTKAKKMFTPGGQAGGCFYATGSANALWVSLLQYYQTPNQVGQKLLERRAADYQDNLAICKEGVRKLK